MYEQYLCCHVGKSEKGQLRAVNLNKEMLKKMRLVNIEKMDEMLN